MTNEELSGGVAGEEPESEASDETPADKAKSKKKSSKKNGQRKGGPAKNKKGKKAQKPGRHVPLSTAVAGVLAAVLLVTPSAWVNLAHLGMRAAEVKRRAKMKGTGAVLVESA